MAQAKKEKLVALPWERKGKSMRDFNRRAVKLAFPQCASCQETGIRYWADKCPHNPYFTEVAVPKIVRVRKCMKCGEEVEPGVNIHCEQTNFDLADTKESVTYTSIPNIREVTVDEAVDSGQSVRRARQYRGAVDPETLGIAPMCQFSRCYEPNPKIKTGWGDYCSKDEARLVALHLGEEAVEIMNEKVRATQLRGVPID